MKWRFWRGANIPLCISLSVPWCRAVGGVVVTLPSAPWCWAEQRFSTCSWELVKSGRFSHAELCLTRSTQLYRGVLQGTNYKLEEKRDRLPSRISALPCEITKMKIDFTLILACTLLVGTSWVRCHYLFTQHWSTIVVVPIPTAVVESLFWRFYLHWKESELREASHGVTRKRDSASSWSLPRDGALNAELTFYLHIWCYRFWEGIWSWGFPCQKESNYLGIAFGAF